MFELLFGVEEEEEKRPAPARAGPAPPRQPEKPIVEKSFNATRVSVFGDSLAVDLARALEQIYAEDPNLVILNHGVGSSGLVRNDFYDWQAALGDAIALNSFDVAIIIIGINDRQPIATEDGSLEPLSDPWRAAYQSRALDLLNQLGAAGKPAIWVGLPPMEANTYSTAMSQISSLHRLASFAGGAEFVDIFERFTDEGGAYTSFGPDINGRDVQVRKSDGIHFSSAGAEKLAFYVNQSLKLFYNGSSLSVAVADPLQGTDAAAMLRPPFQGLGQIRLLEVAGAVTSLNQNPKRATELVLAVPPNRASPGIDLPLMMAAPVGRADAFGVGIEPEADETDEPTAQ